MESHEHSPEQPQDHNAPIDKSSSLSREQTVLENPQKSFGPKTPETKRTLSSSSNDPPKASPEQLKDPKWWERFIKKTPVEDLGSRAWGREDFDYDLLSANAKRLYSLLLCEIGTTKYLPEIAKHEGIEDLEGGLAELRRHQLLDESEDGFIGIVSERI